MRPRKDRRWRASQSFHLGGVLLVVVGFRLVVVVVSAVEEETASLGLRSVRPSAKRARRTLRHAAMNVRMQKKGSGARNGWTCRSNTSLEMMSQREKAS